jgi:hypothetical protein
MSAESDRLGHGFSCKRRAKWNQCGEGHVFRSYPSYYRRAIDCSKHAIAETTAQ